ncbi:GIY-YIG catalytic domain protein [compost metagenome]
MIDIIDSIMLLNSDLGKRKLIRLSFADIIKEHKNDFPAAYFIRAEDGRFYVGGTKRIKSRLNQHRGYLRAGTHVNDGLQTLYNTLGEAKLSFWLIPCTTRDEAQEIEAEILRGNHGHFLCLNISSDPHAPVRGYDRTVAINKIRAYQQSEQGKAVKSAQAKAMWQDADTRNTILEKLGETITVDGVSYLSVREASRKTGFSIMALRNHLRDGVVLTEDIKVFRKKISIAGVVYESMEEAARVLGVKSNTLHWRINHTADRWADHFYIDGAVK